MEVRELKPEDLDELRALVQEVYSDSQLAMWFDRSPSEADLNELFRLKMLGITSKSAVDLIAIEHGKIIGECEIVFTGESHVMGIIVSKSKRRKGVGNELLAKGIDAARKLKFPSVFAEVAEENLPGMKFFIKNGFEQKGISDRLFSSDGKTHRIIYFKKELYSN